VNLRALAARIEALGRGLSTGYRLPADFADPVSIWLRARLATGSATTAIASTPDDRSDLQRAIDEVGLERFLSIWEARDCEERAKKSFDWEFCARKKQLPPPGRWRTWHLRAGRGFGKTKTGAEWVRWKIEREGKMRGGIVAPTAADVRDVMVEGPSGILAVCPPWNRPLYEPSKHRLTWPNGAQCATYSAEEPDRLRGPQHEFVWADELAAWASLEEAWDMIQFGLRQGHGSQALITSTPRGLKFLRTLEADPKTVTITGSTYENEENLDADFIATLKTKYEGTRLGLQEISAIILDDNPGALWKRKLIDAKRLSFAEFAALKIQLRRVVVGLDPATTSSKNSDEAGIVAAGIGMCACNGVPDLHGFVLEDDTDIYTPNQTTDHVMAVYRRRMANIVVGETNQGGDWIESLFRTHPEARFLKYLGVHAKDGKRLRAEPVVALYEQGKVHHVGMFAKLEDEMCTWDPKTSDDSPDRIDALVHALTAMLVLAAPPTVRRGAVADPSRWGA
jgi:phage terminase large subunit-like protein